jgi:hypothetical protein
MHTVFFVGKREGRRLLFKPRSRWEDNIKKCLREKYGGKVHTGLIWPRMETSDGLL